MRRRESFSESLWKAVQAAEGRFIRGMVLAAVVLVVMQLQVIRDPLQYYLAVASKIEAPPLEVPVPAYAVSETGVWPLVFTAVPAAPVRILQNGKLLGTLAQGRLLVKVQAGQVQLDGTGVSKPVRVQIVQPDSGLAEPRLNQSVLLRGDTVSLTVRP